jgi:hypothetical protein
MYSQILVHFKVTTFTSSQKHIGHHKVNILLQHKDKDMLSLNGSLSLLFETTLSIKPLSATLANLNLTIVYRLVLVPVLEQPVVLE